MIWPAVVIRLAGAGARVPVKIRIWHKFAARRKIRLEIIEVKGFAPRDVRMMVVVMMICARHPEGRMLERNVLAGRRFCAMHRVGISVHAAMIGEGAAMIGKGAATQGAGTSAGSSSSSAHPAAAEVAASASTAAMAAAGRSSPGVSASGAAGCGGCGACGASGAGTACSKNRRRGN